MFGNSLLIDSLLQWRESSISLGGTTILLALFFFVGQLHKDAPTEEHPGNLAILMSQHFNSKSPSANQYNPVL